MKTHKNNSGVYDRGEHGFICKGNDNGSYSWSYVPHVGTTQWFASYEQAKAAFDAAHAATSEAEITHTVTEVSGAEFEARVAGNTLRSEGGLLGALIYNAQQARRVRKLERTGWIRASQETLARFIGKTVRMLENGSLRGETAAKVKQLGGAIRLCPPKSRTKYFGGSDLWINPEAAQ